MDGFQERIGNFSLRRFMFTARQFFVHFTPGFKILWQQLPDKGGQLAWRVAQQPKHVARNRLHVVGEGVNMLHIVEKVAHKQGAGGQLNELCGIRKRLGGREAGIFKVAEGVGRFKLAAMFHIKQPRFIQESWRKGDLFLQQFHAQGFG